MGSKGPLRAKSGVRVLKVYLRVRCIQISTTRNQMKVCLHNPSGIWMILKIENSKIVGVTNLTGAGGSTLVIFWSFLVDFSKILKCPRIIPNQLYITLNFIRSSYSSSWEPQASYWRFLRFSSRLHVVDFFPDRRICARFTYTVVFGACHAWISACKFW